MDELLLFLGEFLEVSLVCCCFICFCFPTALHFLLFSLCSIFFVKVTSWGTGILACWTGKEPEDVFHIRLISGFCASFYLSRAKFLTLKMWIAVVIVELKKVGLQKLRDCLFSSLQQRSSSFGASNITANVLLSIYQSNVFLMLRFLK